MSLGDFTDLVPKYVIQNPINSSAHVRGHKHSASSIENGGRMVYSKIQKYIIEHIQIIKLS